VKILEFSHAHSATTGIYGTRRLPTYSTEKLYSWAELKGDSNLLEKPHGISTHECSFIDPDSLDITVQRSVWAIAL